MSWPEKKREMESLGYREVNVVDRNSQKAYWVPEKIRATVSGDGYVAVVDVVRIDGSYSTAAFGGVDLDLTGDGLAPLDVQRLGWGQLMADALSASCERAWRNRGYE